MKEIRAMRAILLAFSLILMLASCKKEFVDTNDAREEFATASNHGAITRAYRDSFDADLNFVPDIANGWAYPNTAPAWYHGFGEGNATHMGNVKGYFNTYGLRNAANIVMVYNRPVTMFYASQLEPYNVPLNVGAVIFDDRGNSIWFEIPVEGWTSEVINATRIYFSGTHLIVGGTGKFQGATGETFIQGYFNPLDLQEFTFWRNGWIRY